MEALVYIANDLYLSWYVVQDTQEPTQLALDLVDYYSYRAKVLNEFVEPRLMDVDRAKLEFEKLFKKLRPSCPIPMNKQKGVKKAPAYLTGIVEANLNGMGCDYDPRELTTVTKNGKPLRTMARRVDGALPSAVNPIAIWEIKEYYYRLLRFLSAVSKEDGKFSRSPRVGRLVQSKPSRI